MDKNNISIVREFIYKRISIFNLFLA